MDCYSLDRCCQLMIRRIIFTRISITNAIHRLQSSRPTKRILNRWLCRPCHRPLRDRIMALVPPQLAAVALPLVTVLYISSIIITSSSSSKDLRNEPMLLRRRDDTSIAVLTVTTAAATIQRATLYSVVIANHFPYLLLRNILAANRHFILLEKQQE